MKKAIMGSLLGITVFAAACATTPSGPPKRYCSDGRELPRWVFTGGAAFPGDRGKVFYGRGEAGGISDSSLRNEAAQNRATGDLAKSFKVAVKSLMDDYRASTGAEGKEAAERHTEAVQRTVVDQTLSGVVLADMCEDTSNGATYALVKLDTDSFENAIEKNRQLGEKMKEFVRQNAEKSFSKLEGATGGNP
ncbi:MAG: LPP20 family lipoprotein [Nitrospinae bacterium]|nr:LPP20 family lipoprotein [Nitrospinota bacterium]